jgi:hypothetical protein
MDFRHFDRRLDRDLQAIAKDANAAEIVARLDTIADLLTATDKALSAVWLGVRGAGVEARVQAILTDFDFLMCGRELREFADQWQARIDAEAA